MPIEKERSEPDEPITQLEVHEDEGTEVMKNNKRVRDLDEFEKVAKRMEEGEEEDGRRGERGKKEGDEDRRGVATKRMITKTVERGKHERGEVRRSKGCVVRKDSAF